jgi:hypothetical protein
VALHLSESDERRTYAHLIFFAFHHGTHFSPQHLYPRLQQFFFPQPLLQPESQGMFKKLQKRASTHMLKMSNMFHERHDQMIRRPCWVMQITGTLGTRNWASESQLMN